MPNQEEVARNGRKRAGTANRWGADFQGFVDIPLSPADKETLQAMGDPDPFGILEFLIGATEEGYKVSLVGDDAHGCVIATVTGKSETCKNKGLALSARGPGAGEALVALAYKVVTLAHWGSWTDETVQGARQLSLWG